MAVSSKVVKKTAISALKDRFAPCAMVAAIFVMMSLCCVMLAEFFTITVSMQIVYPILLVLLGVFLVWPLFFGMLRYFWCVYNDRESNPVTVFHYFSSRASYGRLMGIILRFLLRAIGFALLIIVPGHIVQMLSQPEIYDTLKIAMPQFIPNLWFLADTLTFLCYLLWIKTMLRWYLVPFYFIADEEMDPDEIIHTSLKISKSTRFEFIGLFFSLIHWVIASVFAIPLIFTVPYFVMVYLVHGRFVTARYNRELSEKEEWENTPTFSVGI